MVAKNGTSPQDIGVTKLSPGDLKFLGWPTGWTLSSTPPETPDVWFFPWGAILEPGDSMMVFWRTPQGEETPAIHPAPAYTGTSDITLLNNDAADLALSGLDGIVHYVQWGKAGQALAGDAVAAGKWTAGDVVLRPGEGQELVYDGDGFRASDWTVAEPTSVKPATWGEAKAER